MPSITQNDIDLLMSRITEINHKTELPLLPEDIDVIIANCRYQRAQKAAGIKPKKPAVDISNLMNDLIRPTTAKSSASGATLKSFKLGG